MEDKEELEQIERLKEEIKRMLVEQQHHTIKKLLFNFMVILICLIFTLGFTGFLPYENNRAIILFIIVYTTIFTLTKYLINIFRRKYKLSNSILFRLLIEFSILLMINAVFDHYFDLQFRSSWALVFFFIINFILVTFISIYLVSKMYFRKLRKRGLR